MINKKSRVFNFLIELLLAIVFFAFCMIACVQLFVSGNDLKCKTENLQKVYPSITSIVEKMRVYNGENLESYLGFKDELTIDNYKIKVKVMNEGHYETKISLLEDNLSIYEYNISSINGDVYEK